MRLLLLGVLGMAVQACANGSGGGDIVAAPAGGDGDGFRPQPVRKIENVAILDLTTPVGEGFRVETKTYQALRYRGVVPQQYDFSCGAAALATLLTYHYGIETGEAEIFEAMYKVGEKKKITTQGFSLLDMKNYLAARGINASGFEVTTEELQREGVPAIQLINLNGYLHFVVIKGMNDEKVLVGDPASGLTVYDIETFDSMREGTVAFVLTDFPSQGRQTFARTDADFRTNEEAPIEFAFDRPPLAVDDLLRLGPEDFILQGLD